MNVMVQTCTRTGDRTENKAEIWIISDVVYIKNTGSCPKLWFARKYLLCTPMTRVTDI